MKYVLMVAVLALVMPAYADESACKDYACNNMCPLAAAANGLRATGGEWTAVAPSYAKWMSERVSKNLKGL